jgi:hypothetical protein
MNDGSLGENFLSIGEKNLSIGDKKLSIGDKNLSLGENQRSMGEKNLSLGENQRSMRDKILSFGDHQRSMKDKNFSVRSRVTSTIRRATSVKTLRFDGKWKFLCLTPASSTRNQKGHDDVSEKEYETCEERKESGCRQCNSTWDTRFQRQNHCTA